jgi:thiamine pyrophosphate-dependent acetolactate synthase large subunit-like protein
VASDGPSADEVTHREAPLQAVSCVERSVLGATRPLAMAGARPIAAPACERLWVSLIERADSPVVMGARERVPVPESGACSRVQMLLWTIDQLAH